MSKQSHAENKYLLKLPQISVSDMYVNIQTAGQLKPNCPRSPAGLESVGSKVREGCLPVCLSELHTAEQNTGALEGGLWSEG